MTIAMAILLGTAFGFVLQRIGAADPDEIIAMLRLTGLRLMKTILLAIGVSSAVLFLSMSLGVIDSGHLSVKAAYVGVLVGGLLLGAGWALSGFCPGTGLVAAGSGRKDAVAFIAGGLTGAGLFMVMYDGLEDTWLFEELFGGKTTLAQTEGYEALVSVNGLVTALVVSAVMIGAAFALPDRFRTVDA